MLINLLVVYLKYTKSQSKANLDRIFNDEYQELIT